MIARTLASLALFASVSTPALAQAVADQPPAPAAEEQKQQAPAKPGPTPEQMRLLATAAAMSQSVFAKDFYMTVGLGAGMVPSYEGSDQYVFFPAPIVQGSYKGYNLSLIHI